MNRVFQINLVVDVGNKHAQQQYEGMHRRRLNEAQEVARKYLKNCGIEVLGSDFLIRDIVKEEAIALVPRKVHYGLSVYPCCRTKIVSKRYITEDAKKVTCKHCVRKLLGIVPPAGQKELFP